MKHITILAIPILLAGLIISCSSDSESGVNQRDNSSSDCENSVTLESREEGHEGEVLGVWCYDDVDTSEINPDYQPGDPIFNGYNVRYLGAILPGWGSGTENALGVRIVNENSDEFGEEIEFSPSWNYGGRKLPPEIRSRISYVSYDELYEETKKIFIYSYLLFFLGEPDAKDFLKYESASSLVTNRESGPVPTDDLIEESISLTSNFKWWNTPYIGKSVYYRAGQLVVVLTVGAPKNYEGKEQLLDGVEELAQFSAKMLKSDLEE